ncbi:LysR family transcriptional regulator [Prosthecodimorpha staleyi]|uniref:LysR family transcriptional regulator n=1 Tax=Prosthecodimorpha staleyi TaxID=2840188 RepID=A0A947D501_9HYPH|nr:LysR family transcriptional regulator [Prosthecodimorpha staleyi]MBT9288247.1 LysR family transcriptional regulator [Prosthecodimorpha staleyi]
MHGTALRYFMEVVRTGSIAEASLRLNVAGSAISRQIGKLEADLGVELFERRPRGMVPSQAGELLARHARRTFLDAEGVVLDLQRLRGLATGVVRVAATEGFGMILVPAAIRAFREQHPGIRFELKVTAPGAVTRLVRGGDVDIGLTFTFAPEPDVRIIAAGRAQIVAVMSRHHPLAGRAALSLAELAGEPLALPEKDTTARQIFDIACGLAGVTVEPVLESNYIAALWSFVEMGGGLTIASAFTVHTRSTQERIASVPITGPAVDQRRYEVQAMLGRRLPDAAEAFAVHVIAAIDDLLASYPSPGG